ncbi:MAG: serine hydrolase domain-containing protein [Acidimicrobiales bacterium]
MSSSAPAATAPIDGHCDARFERVRAEFARNFAERGDVGAAVAVVHRGELVVDLWGGHTDETRTVEWQRDSIVNVFSVTKTMTALALLLLIDRGEVDPDAPVATYWPEFGAHGKQDVLVRHVMSHTAGLPGWPQPIEPAVLYDWDAACAALADQPTWWEPGTASGYHSLSQGYLSGEIVRRVTGHSLGQFVAREITGPLGADFHIGTSAAHDARVVDLIPPGGSRPDPSMFPEEEVVARRAFANIRGFQAADSATIAWRRAEIPAANGHGNARSIALAQALVSHRGEVFGRRLLSPTAPDVIFRPQCDNVDKILFQHLRHGIGWGLRCGKLELPSDTACWWDGWGGSLCVNDVGHGFTLAYTTDKMMENLGPDARTTPLWQAVYDIVA